jgi:transcriptional regulator with XRE-family HTH domain
MERTRLIAARETVGLTQAELADKINYSREALSQWERGDSTPGNNAILELCNFFGKNPADLDLACDLTESELAMLQEILKNKKANRRQALALMTLPAFAGVDFSALDKPLISHGASLNLCRAAIQGCWYLFDHGGIAEASIILKECEGALSELAAQSRYQGLAATLAVEVKIIQMAMATQRGDYRVREQLGLNAVDIAEMSGDGDIHAMALGWHGDTYKYCLFQPKTAIAALNDALKCGDISPLNKAATFSDLGVAYALDRNQKKARHYIELAQMTMPDHPESDPLYRCIRTGQSEIDQRVGRVYLILAGYFSKGDYAQMAYDTSVQSLGKPSLSLWHRGEILIQKAVAARGTENFDEFFKALNEGIPIAIQLDSKMDKDAALKALGKVPDDWKNDQRYKHLLEMF